MKNSKQVFNILVVALLTLSFAACTKSKRNKFGAVKPQPAASLPVAPPTPEVVVDKEKQKQKEDLINSPSPIESTPQAPDTVVLEENEEPKEELKPDKPIHLGTTPIAGVNTPGSGNNSNGGSNSPETSSATTPSTPAAPSASQESTVNPLSAEEIAASLSGYNELEPLEVTKFRSARNETGQVENGFVYTGSAVDQSLSEAIVAMDKLTNEKQKAINKVIANKIKFVRTTQEGSLAVVKVTVKLNEKGLEKEFTFSGNTVVNLKNQIKMAYLKSEDRTVPVQGRLYCLDEDGGCENAAVVFSGKVKSHQGYAVVITRTTAMSMFVKSQLSEPCDKNNAILELIKNTQEAETVINTNSNKLQSSRMKTFEVLGGKSGVSIVMLSTAQEILDLRGYLLTEKQSTKAKSKISATSNFKRGSPLQKQKSTLKENVKGASIVNNNGLGQIKISALLSSCDRKKKNSLDLTFMRHNKKVKSISELLSTIVSQNGVDTTQN